MSGVCTLLIAFGALAAADAPLARYTYSHMQMGMKFELTLYSADEAAANRAAKAVFQRVDQINGILSDYDPDSELSRLSDTAGSGKAVKLSEPLAFVLARAQDLSERSDGAF